MAVEVVLHPSNEALGERNKVSTDAKAIANDSRAGKCNFRVKGDFNQNEAVRRRRNFYNFGVKCKFGCP